MVVLRSRDLTLSAREANAANAIRTPSAQLSLPQGPQQGPQLNLGGGPGPGPGPGRGTAVARPQQAVGADPLEALRQQTAQQQLAPSARRQVAPVDQRQQGSFGERFSAGFKANPIAAIGMILSGIGGNTAAISAYQNIAAGQAAANKTRFQAWDTTRRAVTEVVGQARSMAPEDAEEFIRNSMAGFEKMSPGGTALAFDLYDAGHDGDDMIQGFREFGDILFQLYGPNVPGAMEYYRENREALENMADARNPPLIIGKLDQLLPPIIGEDRAFMESIGLGDVELPKNEDGEIMLSFLDLVRLNDFLRDENSPLALTDSELGTIRRQDHIVERYGIASLGRTEAQRLKEGQLAATVGTAETTFDRFGRTITKNIDGSITVSGEGTNLQQAELAVSQAKLAIKEAYDGGLGTTTEIASTMMREAFDQLQRAQVNRDRVARGEQPEFIDLQDRRTELQGQLEGASPEETENINQQIKELNRELGPEPTEFQQAVGERNALRDQLETELDPVRAEQIRKDLVLHNRNILDDLGTQTQALQEYRRGLRVELESAQNRGETQKAANIEQEIDEVTLRLSAVQATEADVAARAGLRAAATADVTRVNEALDALRSGNIETQQIATLLHESNNEQAIAGVRGWAARRLGGLVAQVGLGDLLEQFLSGGEVSREDAQRFASNAQAVIAQSIEYAVGEESGRVTGAELAITTAIVAALDPLADTAVIRGGLEAVLSFDIIQIESNRITAGMAPSGALRELVDGEATREEEIAAITYLRSTYALSQPSALRLVQSLSHLIPLFVEAEEKRP
jgi:uncharacterized protein YidB (DUF937 family)